MNNDEVIFDSMRAEAKRKQDKANYIKYLLDTIEMLRSEINGRTSRAVKIIEEYEIKKEPLCDLNAILLMIKTRIKNK